MPVLHMDHARKATFYSPQIAGWVRDAGYSESREETLCELIDNGKIKSWHFRICAKHATFNAAHDLISKFRQGVFVFSEEDKKTSQPDIDTAHIEEISIKIVPITLSTEEAVLGRAQSVIRSLPSEIRHGADLSEYLRQFEKIKAIPYEDFFSESKTHRMTVHECGYVSPNTSSAVLRKFREATKFLQPSQYMDISNPDIMAFIASASYTKADLNGLVEDFPFEDDALWQAMTEVASTPLWEFGAYTILTPRNFTAEQQARDDYRDKFYYFTGKLAPDQRDILAKAAPKRLQKLNPR